MNTYRLHFSFLPARESIREFKVYRKLRLADQKNPDPDEIHGYRLDSSEGDGQARTGFWVSLEQREGFLPYMATGRENPGLTKWLLLRSLARRCESAFGKSNYRAFELGFNREVAIVLARHPEGEEEIVWQPYFLHATGSFGFLVDYHFRRKPDVPFSRRILQLSLSLDHQNRLNANFYADKLAKAESFLQEHFHDLFPIKLPGVPEALEFERSFPTLEAHVLAKKRYIVGREQLCSGPFGGISAYGPWQTIAECPPLIFVFREQERQAARELVKALRGQTPRLNFAGFERLFKLPLPVSDKPVVIADFSKPEMERALREIQAGGRKTLPVLILPHSEGEETYTTHKAVFTNVGISTQVCTTETIADDYTLKWSVGNMALQIFCKAGGQPWKVKAADEHCLIIGLGQSHKRKREKGKEVIDKYFTFSILTDSSGLFQSIEVLGQDESEVPYILALKASLAQLLKTKSKEFAKVVIHAPFKLKLSEMEVVEEVVAGAAKEATSCKFAVLKVNQHNRFFAVNRGVNSLVPYEGSYLQLSRREFLIWFEGLYPDKPNLTKAVPGPTHVEFLWVSDESLVGDKAILQDLLNLSGANWRGFNAKSTPVSVFYCHLVADMLHEFQTLNLPMPPIKEIHPWFL